MTKLSRDTSKWIRNRSDELAVEAGCRFNEDRGRHPIDFAAKYLRLYEGRCAGEPLIAQAWQEDAAMRLFGWEKYSEKLGRWIRRFRSAAIWLAKKNGKSPTLSWWALYLLCADGEPGQKVFLAAKDGSQAREIAGKHAMEMVMASPDLMAVCTTNKTLMLITHEPTRSSMRPLSSGDSRTQKSKEGINGSVLIDETHVVDRDFIGRISRAGISRDEPLQIEVSTAGDDPESYGKSQWDYGLDVEAGRVVDQSFLHIAYAAPQDLSDSELARDPVKYGKLANPMWGHTVFEEEYLADYERSKRRPSDFAQFKQYRLNIWQRSLSPWLDAYEWEQCGEDYSEVDFLGASCGAGLDLSMSRDMTSLVLAFNRDGAIWLLPYFWLPRETVERYSHVANFEGWAQANRLRILPGSTIEYGRLGEEIVDILRQFNVTELAYDPYNADMLTDTLEREHGIRRAKFPQTINLFAKPTAELERRILNRELRHPKHPVLTWQAGHVRCITDHNRNRRPTKPKHGDMRTIDGIVASIMALDRALATDTETLDYYETHDLEVI